MMPGVQHLYSVIEGTWPAAAVSQVGPWTIRDGQGGGQRVSAATTATEVFLHDLPDAEAAMRRLGQPQLFMIRDGDADLDAVLEAAGYPIVDPVNIYVAPLTELMAERPPKVTTFAIWEPLEIMRDIWAAGGIGPERIEVMARVKGPKTGLFGRSNNRPAAAGFVAVFERIAMVHALEVLERHRREGMGCHMMRQAAFWAAEQGATHMSVICTQANAAANALYSSLGLTLVGQYHYRRKG
ncbi:GNAT family N-acetyltransferase [Roseovarius aestuarii]|uniref:Acetyltransferase (GNAT) family protein n=2 Tax=Roseovarius aestuarii TaxID=475083 RepID=A0A1X7BT45_9RHOB|nr:GNAT family N-acetyltransferase [Roseovarius aestuarii]SMC12773.1 Acetyltransferase (GNAT) family protein [Roseovarius aestuarii]